MIFPYGKNKAPWVKASSTLEAIKLGERTATTRYLSDGHLDYWISATVGDIILFKGWNNEVAYVRVTRPLRKLTLNNITREEWCKLEGWNYEKFDNKIKPLIIQGEAYQMEYEYIGDTNQPSYFKSSDFAEFKYYIDNIFNSINKPIVIPRSGLGNDLPENLKNYLLQKILEMYSV